MILQAFSVFDAAAGAYLPPFYERASGAALRSFMSAANDPKHAFFHNAKDYTLFRIGEFDDQTGIFHPLKAHEPLGKALDYKQTE